MSSRCSVFPSVPELEGRALQGAVVPQHLWEAGRSLSYTTAIATRCMGRHRSRAQWPEQHCMMVYFVRVPVSCRLCFVKPCASHLFTLGWFFNPVKLARQDCPSQEDLLLCLFCPTLSLFLCIGRLRTELCAFFYETKIIFETFVD